jgi:hypothetical protein
MLLLCNSIRTKQMYILSSVFVFDRLPHCEQLAVEYCGVVCTVICFVSISAKFGICTVVGRTF